MVGERKTLHGVVNGVADIAQGALNEAITSRAEEMADGGADEDEREEESDVV